MNPYMEPNQHRHYIYTNKIGIFLSDTINQINIKTVLEGSYVPYDHRN